MRTENDSRVNRNDTSVIQAEGDFHVNRHAHGMAVLHSRLEAPVVERLNGLLIKARIDGMLDSNVLSFAAFIHHRGKQHDALNSAAASLIGVFGLRLGDHLRGGGMPVRHKRNIKIAALIRDVVIGWNLKQSERLKAAWVSFG